MRQRAFCPVAWLLAAAVLAVIGCSGSAVTPSPTVTATPIATPSPSPTTAPTPTPTPTPTPGPGFVQTGSGIEYKVGDGTTLRVPEIPGLVASLGDLRVTYAALASNPYGLKAGAYAGVFNPFVSEMQAGGSEQLTGGIGLVPAVCSTLLKQEVAKIANRADKWMYVVPLAGAVEDSDIRISSAVDSHGQPMQVVNFSGDLTLTNPNLLGEGVMFGTSLVPAGFNVSDSYRAENYPASDLVSSSDPWHLLALFGSFFDRDASGQAKSLPTNIFSKFGDRLCMVNTAIYLMFADKDGYYPVTQDKLLRVTDSRTNHSYAVFLETATAK